jgi:predicted acetylornithine/succinylornithine family transaminase
MAESTQRILERGKELLIGNYARQPVVMSRGQGAEVWDSEGKRYVDLFAGFGGAVLGHSHPALVEAAAKQAQKLWHVGNTFYSEPQIEFAERLARTAFKGQGFFCHSGLEANEAAVKLARLRHKETTPKRYKIISLNKSFHGRSLAMIAATGNPKIKAGFEPMVAGFVQVEPGDFSALEAAVDAETAGVIMEPIQGEGGVNLYPADYAAKVRELCDRRGLTLIFDEVWTGGGRTGKWFAHQFFTKAGGAVVEPDVMTLGKAVGGGLPVGVMWAKAELAKLMVPSTHGSTLGANMICMAVARTIFDVIEREGWVEHARQLGEQAMGRLRSDAKIKGKVMEVRGRGLMLGIELKDAPEKIVEKGLERGVILNLTATKVIRLAPPINISKALWEEGLDRVVDAIAAG